MDLLEYQGKQPLRKRGVPVPEGRRGASVGEAVESGEELSFPVVIKAQHAEAILVEIPGARI